MKMPDTLARLEGLQVEPPEWRDVAGLQQWLLSILEDSQATDHWTEAMAQFAERELGLQGEEYLQWLQAGEKDSLRLRAWTYQALALYKASQYRQEHKERQG